MSGTIQERRWRHHELIDPAWTSIQVDAVATNPGGVNTLAPVIDTLTTEKGVDVILLTAGKINEPENVVPTFPFRQIPEISELSTTPNLDRSSGIHRIVLVSSSTLPAMELELGVIQRAVEADPDHKHTTIVFCEDNIAGGRGLFRACADRGIPPSTTIDRICLANAAAARAYLRPEDDFGIPRNHMVLTGSPTFDSVRAENTPRVNREVRETLELPQDIIVIAFLGMPSTEPGLEGIELTTLRTVGRAAQDLAAIHRTRNVALAYRRHPRDPHPEQLRALLPDSSRNLRVISHEESMDTHHISTRHMTAAADLGVSLSSTELTAMAVRGAREEEIDAVQDLDDYDPFTPNHKTGNMPLFHTNADALRVHASQGYELPIAIQLGAAAVCWNDDELVRTMEATIFDTLSRARITMHQATALKAEYAFDPNVSSAELIVKELEILLAEHR